MVDSKKNIYKRRIYFIDKKFQTKFILKFCALVALAGVLTVGILYILGMQSTTIAIVNSRVVVRSTADFLLPILIQTALIVTVVVSLATIAVTLFVSHKISGPLYRFKKVMQSLGEGDFSFDFKIRRLDQLQDVAREFNEMIAKIRNKIALIKGSSTALKEKIENISDNEIAEGKRTLFNELKQLSREIYNLINFFKS